MITKKFKITGKVLSTGSQLNINGNDVKSKVLVDVVENNLLYTLTTPNLLGPAHKADGPIKNFNTLFRTKNIDITVIIHHMGHGDMRYVIPELYLHLSTTFNYKQHLYNVYRRNPVSPFPTLTLIPVGGRFSLRLENHNPRYIEYLSTFKILIIEGVSIYHEALLYKDVGRGAVLFGDTYRGITLYPDGGYYLFSKDYFSKYKYAKYNYTGLPRLIQYG